MIKELDSIKFSIIKEIMEIDEASVLTRIKEDISSIRSQSNLLEKVFRPTRSKITLDEMKKEQNYTPIQKEEFFKLTEEIGIEESLEELLSQLD